MILAGPELYERCVDDVVTKVLKAKDSSQPKLRVISLHDTSNSKCAPNGTYIAFPSTRNHANLRVGAITVARA